VTRRGFLGGSAATAGAGALAAPGVAAASDLDLQERIIGLFRHLPGIVSLKILAPPHAGRRGLLVEHQASRQMFVGSAIKTFVLCEALRQADSPTVTARIAARQLALNASVWSPDSASFNPPFLAGRVSERTAMEAMITHSDNTGTDMMLKLTGPDNVRRFIASIGLHSTLIPDSTRVFFGYLLGAKNYRHFTWADVVAAEKENKPYVHSPLNRVQTLASSADDFVSYYSRALRGAFFKHPQTLSQYLEIQQMADLIWLLPVPLGVSAFAKGGSIDTPGFHAVCAPGGMFFDDRWVFFCMTINWFAKAELDPATVAAFAAAGSKALQIVKGALATR
jgi:beta-lactamase class A